MNQLSNLYKMLSDPYLKGSDKPVGRQKEYFAKQSIDFLQSLGRFANNHYRLEITPWGESEPTVYECRVEDSFDEQANTKRGDDWKDLLFYDDFPELTIGMKAQLHGCTWIGYNTRNIAALTTSITIRRCDNVLNFVDEFGNVTAEPFVFDKYTVLNSTNIAKPADPATLINGYKNAWIQYNDLTAKLRTNDRFIIQGQAFVVRGVDYYSRQTTNDRNSVKLISFVLAKTEETQGDDLINDIANADAYVWTISVDAQSITGAVGQTGNVGAELFHRGLKNAEYSILYESSNENVVTVDAEGNYTILSEGNATITCAFEKNLNVTATVDITATEQDESVHLLFNPEIKRLKQHESASTTAVLMKGAAELPVTITIEPSGVPSGYYTFTQTENTATVKCNAPYTKGNLTLTAIAEYDGQLYTASMDIILASAF